MVINPGVRIIATVEVVSPSKNGSKGVVWVGRVSWLFLTVPDFVLYLFQGLGNYLDFFVRMHSLNIE